MSLYLFVAIKAIHLEIVSDLATDAFLNAFKRFTSRRGKPTNVYSDNDKNFVGANKKLEKCRELFDQEQRRRDITDFTDSQGIRWHFIPAHVPYFGELWERVVKLFKTYSYKTTIKVPLTFKEVSTLMSQIETILNSSPLTALTNDANDLSYLSPGHFLIGNTLTSYPEVDLTDTKINRLSRWQLLEQIRQHFWKR